MTMRLPSGRLFLALNGVALIALVALCVTLVADRFVARRAVAAEQGEDLGRLAAAQRRTAALAHQIAGRGDPFLSANDERLGSADLQAILQEIARTKGAALLGVRGLPNPRQAGLRLVAAKLEFEGSLEQVQGVVTAVEGHLPLLWIDAAVVRDAGTGTEPGTMLHAELQVQAALAAAPMHPGESLATGAPPTDGRKP